MENCIFQGYAKELPTIVNAPTERAMNFFLDGFQADINWKGFLNFVSLGHARCTTELRSPLLNGAAGCNQFSKSQASPDWKECR